MSDPQTTVRLTHEPLGPAAPAPPDPRWGGTVTFVGTVRTTNRGRRVRALQYEAYEPMARAVIGQIADEARQRFDLAAISVQHRLGRLVPGDVAVKILVGAAHRDAAFGGCRFLIDELKRRAPIWKKEAYDDGEAWIDGSGSGDAGGAHG
ncbi:MAG: molybdenum cofactor biosynthesis protein MoaE [Candidatus Eiseniibacteriota bacterium]